MVSHHFLFLALFILCSSLYIVGHENFVPHTILKGEGRLNCSCCLALGGEASDSWGQQYFFKAVLLSNVQNNKMGSQKHRYLLYMHVQFGIRFRSKHSYQTQLLQIINDWSSAINTNSTTHAIFLDFSKAFDSVPHQRLLGIRGNLLKWTKAFLVGREQRVIDGSFSPWTMQCHIWSPSRIYP